jgi:hypothetical protein
MVGIVAPPVTYSVDGEQYIAVLAGYGGAGAVTGGDPRTMASGRYLNEGHILAFKLGGTAPLPKIAERNLEIPPPAATRRPRRSRTAVRAHRHPHGVPWRVGGVRRSRMDLRRLTTKDRSSSRSLRRQIHRRACRGG